MWHKESICQMETIQLSLKQRKSELPGSSCMQIFFTKYICYSNTDPGIIAESTDMEQQISGWG